jgi:Ca2+-transporting ATPase
MLLWINLIMDTLGALAMATEGPDIRVLEQPPRRKDETVSGPTDTHV